MSVLVSLEGLQEIEAQQAWMDAPEPQCWVYEVWDRRGRLAYVGIADNFERRWAQHVRSSWWLGEIEVWYVTVHGYQSRSDARQMEAGAINEQHPVYNTRKEPDAYRLYRGWWDDPDRPVNEWDCVAIWTRRFLGVEL